MKRANTYYPFLLLLVMFCSCKKDNGESAKSKQHPLLILQQNDIPEIINGIDRFPLLESSFQQAKQIADQGIAAGISVPVPKDPGGGYTHEKHKQNYLEMYHSGLVYQMTKDEQYAMFVRDMLKEYQDLYPGLDLHPMRKDQAPGKLFWQGLNESVWLVYTIQAYDCIYEFLTPGERISIENKLFRNVVKFFTEDNPFSFDRVHNHGTWAVAGVGMTGMVLDDSAMIQQALYSTKLDGSGGFLRQIDELFSPDGYYAEGPYYQRYALMPFILFARALENLQPELGIFEYKGGVLIKAVQTVLQLTNTDGSFYPINDAIKEKSWLTPELIFGTNVVFALTGDKNLLPVARDQGTVMLSKDGLAVARSISNQPPGNFDRNSMLIRDGLRGEKGGLALMRKGKYQEQTSVLFKFSSQGMGHGHFDRLGILMYDRGQEILPDYGAARFLNVKAKEGGRYLKENESWAKQTVAHNTIVLDQQSNFSGNLEAAEAKHPDLIFQDLRNEEIQVISATDSNCFEDSPVNRTLAFFELEGRRYLVDLFHIKTRDAILCDLPVYFNGQLLEYNFPLTRFNNPQVLGEKNGYQHLLVEARARNLPETSSLTWMNGKGFYSMTFLTEPGTEFLVTRLGANDPGFNLREQSGMMIRQTGSGQKLFLKVFEIHGNYNPVSEIVTQSEGSIESLQLYANEQEKVMVQLELKNSTHIKLLLDLKFSDSSRNEIQWAGESIDWAGNYKLIIQG